MPIRTSTPLSFAFATLAVLLVTACGGGGGGGGSVTPPGGGGGGGTTPTPTPVPTAAPVVVTFPAAIGGTSCTAQSGANCAYTFKSVPSGLSVSINGTTVGTTPFTTSPTFSAMPYTVSFNNGAYTLTIDQTGNHAQTVFYNATTDTGATSLTGVQSSARALASVGTLGTRRAARSSSDGIVPNSVYVRYNASRLQRSISSIESDAGAESGVDVLPSVAAVRGRILHVPNGTDVRTVAARLTAEGAVAGVYPLHYRRALSATRQIVNDYGFTAAGNLQWPLDTIKATYAWTYTKGARGVIAMIDTGVDLNHPDMPGSKVVFEANTAGTNGKVDFSPGAAQDTNGHGTNTAGIAAANTNDGVGYAGVGYNASILAYRIFPQATATSDAQSASTGDEAAAILDASQATPKHAQADVINLSIGSPQNDAAAGAGFDQAEHDAIATAISRGTAVVAAAGNEAISVPRPPVDYPGAYDGVISVGASALLDANSGVLANATEYVATYSNAGPGLSVVAPGGDTERAGNGDASDNLHWIINDSTTTAAFAGDQCRATTLPNVCGFKFNGTSQATPHVSGTIALVQSALRENGRPTLTPAAMLALIQGTADNINDADQGHGRLNALRAVESALGLPQTFAPAVASPTQFVAFAYANSGATRPAIADVFYTTGVPVNANGTFRIADIDPSLTGAYRVAVWLDANGNGVIDAGDQFGASSNVCSSTAKCSVGTIAVSKVTGAFALP